MQAETGGCHGADAGHMPVVLHVGFRLIEQMVDLTLSSR